MTQADAHATIDAAIPGAEETEGPGAGGEENGGGDVEDEGDAAEGANADDDATLTPEERARRDEVRRQRAQFGKRRKVALFVGYLGVGYSVRERGRMIDKSGNVFFLLSSRLPLVWHCAK